jgi:hypothetical protein
MDMPFHRKLPKNCIVETAARTPELGRNSWLREFDHVVASSWRDRLQTLQVKRPSMPSSYIVLKNFTLSSRLVDGNIEIISSKTFLSACASFFGFLHTASKTNAPRHPICVMCASPGMVCIPGFLTVCLFHVLQVTGHQLSSTLG